MLVVLLLLMRCTRVSAGKLVRSHKTQVQHLRLAMVTVVGSHDIEGAVLIQDAIKERMSSYDGLFHVCEHRCVKAAGGRLINMIEIPEPRHLVQNCMLPDGNACNDYNMAAALKFPYGMISVVQYCKRRGIEANWWLLKDYDTYVHVPNLMSAVSGYSPQMNYSFANLQEGCGACGAAGVLLSDAIAQQLTGVFADRWVSFMKEQLLHGVFYWDYHMPNIVHWVNSSRNLDLAALNAHEPFTNPGCVPVHDDTGNNTCKGCNKMSEDILCARSQAPATWHLKHDIIGYLDALDRIP